MCSYCMYSGCLCKDCLFVLDVPGMRYTQVSLQRCVYVCVGAAGPSVS